MRGWSSDFEGQEEKYQALLEEQPTEEVWQDEEEVGEDRVTSLPEPIPTQLSHHSDTSGRSTVCLASPQKLSNTCAMLQDRATMNCCMPTGQVLWRHH